MQAWQPQAAESICSLENTAQIRHKPRPQLVKVTAIVRLNDWRWWQGHTLDLKALPATAPQKAWHIGIFGAGSGNRTRVFSLEG
jgi:hypothetical protein